MKITKFVLLLAYITLNICILQNSQIKIDLSNDNNRVAFEMMNASDIHLLVPKRNMKHLRVGIIDTPVSNGDLFNKKNVKNQTPNLPSINTHGEMITSLLSASWDDNNYVGLIPNLNVYFWGIDRMDSDSLSEAIISAIKNNVAILNISMGTYNDSPRLREAVQLALSKGIIVICSSGNNSSEDLNYPAAYPGVLSVGALNNNGEVFSVTNVNSTVDIYAPGENIQALSYENNNVTLKYFSGTSPATVFVTGLVILTKLKFPQYNADEILKSIINNGTEFSTFWKGKKIRIRVVNYQNTLK